MRFHVTLIMDADGRMAKGSEQWREQLNKDGHVLTLVKHQGLAYFGVRDRDMTQEQARQFVIDHAGSGFHYDAAFDHEWKPAQEGAGCRMWRMGQGQEPPAPIPAEVPDLDLPEEEEVFF